MKYANGIGRPANKRQANVVKQNQIEKEMFGLGLFHELCDAWA